MAMRSMYAPLKAISSVRLTQHPRDPPRTHPRTVRWAFFLDELHLTVDFPVVSRACTKAPGYESLQIYHQGAPSPGVFVVWLARPLWQQHLPPDSV